jgi:omega-6 fatty acid desaturase (delta-12 desaturase)
MKNIDYSRILGKLTLQTLSVIAPKKAGQMATRLFAQSRNTAPYRQSFTPMGAKAIAMEDRSSKVKQIFMWGNDDNPQAEIVLLVHGWGADCASMFGLVDLAIKQGYRVAAFDGPAHGSSEGDHSTMFEYVEATQKVIEQLGQVTRVVAHSLGGLVAMAAASGSQQIRSMTLIATPYCLTDVLDIWSNGFMQLKPNVREEIYAQLLLENGVPVSHWDIGIHGKNWPVPVQVLHDSSDPIVSSAHAKRISDVLPSAITTELNENLGHFKILSSSKVYSEIALFISSPSSINVDNKVAVS